MSVSDADAAASLARQIDEALRRRDVAGALSLIEAAEQVRPADVSLKMQKAVTLRVAGDLPGSLAALDAALALEPYNFMALLGKGALIERLAGEPAAAEVYRNALKIAPANAPPGLQPAIARAREVVRKTADALEKHLRSRLAGLGAACSGPAKARLEETVRVFSGQARVYHHEPLLLHYTQLPEIGFYDRSHFPWLAELEAETDTIRAELEGVLETRADFAPYIAFPPGAPVNQWGELNHSARWSSYFLWKDGMRQDGACAACPKTAGLLERLPMAEQPGFAPTAMFSALEAKTHIPPHTGSTNTRLLCHLPLILPGPARFRVGNQTRPWRMGAAWVFDDTIEHEAWNDADALRVILIFDIWNPNLEPAERELVCALLAARNEFLGH
ncbi:MAG TPA: aspartyl/asparaginyl beta-hydroxylase domain-containing protein [Phenylobacterium sp.]|uniref:aspartyl/asparaginyl beta-hydroxylase domain-containing protein n=1 Tax=Phenylobacterium sp. TaxID=1871053 RepID=UPI002D02B543|nr:aspartyl/asparaginyl beta-hydroxylase domain-containing protein [Phenylobacterium sp.]HSV04065.1 aspartyl/asparaginyl beta-hydroxylase domain-containing protein [Phenylobacterium sp.]